MLQRYEDNTGPETKPSVLVSSLSSRIIPFPQELKLRVCIPRLIAAPPTTAKRQKQARRPSVDKTEHGVPTQAFKARKLHACYNRDEPQYTVSETRQSQKDETTLCDSPHTRHLKQSNSFKTEGRMVVARSWREEEMRAIV